MEDNIGILMTQVGRLLRRNFDARARVLGVTRPQWQVLLELSRHEGINQGGLAELLEVEPMTVGRMIDRLEEARMVERRADPRDRRAWLLYLTTAGRDQLEGLRPYAKRTVESALEGIDQTERDELIRMLLHMRSNLSSRTPSTSQGLGESGGDRAIDEAQPQST